MKKMRLVIFANEVSVYNAEVKGLSIDMVSERLKKTFDFIGASNRNIARYARVDPSLVSRVKSGSREISASSASVAKIANGIYLFCDDRNIIPAFCSLFGGDSSAGKDAVMESFIRWVFEDVPNEPKGAKATKIVPFAANISPKLDRLMKLTDMSNIRLARTTNIDSSYISRIRSGVRTPKSNIELIRSICIALAYRIMEQDKIKGAAKLMGISPELIKNDFDLSNELYIWLCDTKQENSLPAAEMLLDKIEAFSPDNAQSLPDIASFTPEIQKDSSPLYKGTEGLRRAVIRFLADASKDSENELWLYSDQDMDWMVGDESFRIKWFALMAECARNGVRVKIIHNIERSLTEMIAAITSWLPLYMFGTIEPYYCTKRTDDRFSHTIFLCRNRACIRACHVRGCEEDGLFDYHTDGERLELAETEYKNMIRTSKPLVRLYGSGSVPELFSEMGQAANESAVIDAPSLSTMPEQLLTAMLDRAGITGKEREQIKTRREYQARHFYDTLKNGYVRELIPAFSENTILSGGIATDIAEGISYTPSELACHIRNIQALMQKYPNYRVYILPEAPFTNVRAIVNKERVIISRLKSPQISFVFSHPVMHDAFENYISQLVDRCEQDKKATLDKLNRYVNCADTSC